LEGEGGYDLIGNVEERGNHAAKFFRTRHTGYISEALSAWTRRPWRRPCPSRAPRRSYTLRAEAPGTPMTLTSPRRTPPASDGRAGATVRNP
jgi:hypothetical protein